MSMSPATRRDDQVPVTPGKSAIILGRTSYPFVVLRLVGMELYKLRRRAMSKVVGSIAVVLAIIPFLLVGAGTIVTVNAPLSSYQPSCGQQGVNESGAGPPPGCPTLSATQLQQIRNLDVQNTSAPLRLPDSLNLSVQFALIVGTVLFIIVFGTMVGGDYSIGTIRLLYTRGPTRTQFLLARLGAAIFIALAGLIVMTGLGVLTGQMLNLISGIAQDGSFISAGWLGHVLFYLLIAMMNWLIYGVIALFFGILGRSTVAAVVGAFSWLIAEPILSGVLGLLGGLSRSLFGDFLRAIPDYFIANNFNALEQEQSRLLFGSSTNPAISPLHAWIVIACYFAVFTWLAWWINKKRDVTN